MWHWIISVAVAIWVTSSLFMLFFHGVSQAVLRQQGKKLYMSPGAFFLIHFCPIVHTIKCFEVLKRLSEQKRKV